jgi:hypothetical protein
MNMHTGWWNASLALRVMNAGSLFMIDLET